MLYNSDKEDNEWSSDDVNEEEWPDINEEEQQLISPQYEQKEYIDSFDFWKCGYCDYSSNRIYRSTCLLCSMPKLDIILTFILEEKSKITKCKKCNSYIFKDLIDYHRTKCFPLPLEKINNDTWFISLTNIQLDVLRYIHKKSKKLSNKMKPFLINKFIQLEYTEQDLENLIDFIIWKLPMTIRFRYESLLLLDKDTHYRNLFEINKGNGGNCKISRQQWEKKLFGNYYDNGIAKERPKYGCFNVSLNKEGCKSAIGYGDCYFVLNDQTTRWRITFTNGDSAGTVQCGTIDNCCHVLNKFSQTDLKKLILVSKGFEGEEHSDYREIQIHGDILLNRDIKMMYIPKKYIKESLPQTFCQKNNIILCYI